MSHRSAPRPKPEPASDALNAALRLQQAGRHVEAAHALERILRDHPKHPTALWLMGRTLNRLKKAPQAIACLTQAITLRPDNVDILHDLGTAQLAASQFEAAIDTFRRIISLKPNGVEGWSALGYAQGKIKRFTDAEASLHQALKLNPNHAETHNRFGVIRNAQARPDEAIAWHMRAIELAPNSVPGWSNLGNAFEASNRLDEALAAYDRALALDPKNATTKFNHALASLLKGNLRREAWLRYEYRWINLGTSPQRGFPQPLWRGEPIAGKSILVCAEQGLGDTLQFIRYVPLLAALGATVHVEVQPALRALLADTPGAASVRVAEDPLPEFDYQCPLLSLPFAFDTRLETIPADVPYVRAPADRVATWKARLGAPRAPRIGVVWRGNPQHTNDANRSLRFEQFQRVCESGAAEFVCLQLKLNEKEAAFFSSHPECLNPTGQITDFSDTAAIISQLDLVLAVDTSVAHVAAALGKPVWLMLPFAPDWRWLLDRADSPWYPTLRLFRQPAIGDWGSVLDAVIRELGQMRNALAA